MVKRRAVDKRHAIPATDRLPPLYASLHPLVPERHGDLRLRPERDYGFAARATAIPLTCEEFPQAGRHYPIVISGGAAPVPVALVGLREGRCDQIDAQGAWTPGRYVPAYLRRYPFALLREAEGSERAVLCADLSSVQFTTSPGEGRPLFEEGAPAEALRDALEFCTRFEEAMARTRAVMAEAAALGLVDAASVSISGPSGRARVDGFSTISEERVRGLPGETLADLARRGVTTLYAAHHLSMASFAGMGAAR